MSRSCVPAFSSDQERRWRYNCLVYFTADQELNQVLDDLLKGVSSVLGDRLVGLYLQGSLAVGGFDEQSDVDFVVAVESDLSEPEVESLQSMHGSLFDSGPEWARHLEGSYFPTAILRRKGDPIERLWYIDNGARHLVRSIHCNTILVRWVVREVGIPLMGLDPKTLIDPIATEALRAEIFETMVTWGEEILRDPSKYANRFYQGYLVLNYCRMLHDLVRGYPGSKREGAQWAKANLSAAWRDLIDATWDCRPDPARKVREPADAKAYSRTLEFLRYVLAETKVRYARIKHEDPWGRSCDAP